MYHNQRIPSTLSSTPRKLLKALGTLKAHQEGVSATRKFLGETVGSLDRSLALNEGVLSSRPPRIASFCIRCLVHNIKDERNSNACSCDERFCYIKVLTLLLQIQDRHFIVIKIYKDAY